MNYGSRWHAHISRVFAWVPTACQMPACAVCLPFYYSLSAMSFHGYLVHLSYICVGVCMDMCVCVYMCVHVLICMCVCLHMYVCGAEDRIHDPVHTRQMLCPEPYPSPLRQME